MRFTACLLLLSFSAPAHGATVLRFHPAIQREDLAEEAIALLHCLAERSGSAWEFSGETGDHRLELREGKDGSLNGQYRNGDVTKPVKLHVGGADATCDELTPPAASKSVLGPPEEAGPDLPDEEPETASKFPWIWVGATAAAALGVFLIWKSRPAHRSVRMD